MSSRKVRRKVTPASQVESLLSSSEDEAAQSQRRNKRKPTQEEDPETHDLSSELEQPLKRKGDKPKRRKESELREKKKKKKKKKNPSERKGKRESDPWAEMDLSSSSEEEKGKQEKKAKKSKKESWTDLWAEIGLSSSSDEEREGKKSKRKQEKKESWSDPWAEKDQDEEDLEKGKEEKSKKGKKESWTDLWAEMGLSSSSEEEGDDKVKKKKKKSKQEKKESWNDPWGDNEEGQREKNNKGKKESWTDPWAEAERAETSSDEETGHTHEKDKNKEELRAWDVGMQGAEKALNSTKSSSKKNKSKRQRRMERTLNPFANHGSDSDDSDWSWKGDQTNNNIWFESDDEDLMAGIENVEDLEKQLRGNADPEQFLFFLKQLYKISEETTSKYIQPETKELLQLYAAKVNNPFLMFCCSDYVKVEEMRRVKSIKHSCTTFTFITELIPAYVAYLEHLYSEPFNEDRWAPPVSKTMMDRFLRRVITWLHDKTPLKLMLTRRNPFNHGPKYPLPVLLGIKVDLVGLVTAIVGKAEAPRTRQEAAKFLSTTYQEYILQVSISDSARKRKRKRGVVESWPRQPYLMKKAKQQLLFCKSDSDDSDAPSEEELVNDEEEYIEEDSKLNPLGKSCVGTWKGGKWSWTERNPKGPTIRRVRDGRIRPMVEALEPLFSIAEVLLAGKEDEEDASVVDSSEASVVDSSEASEDESSFASSGDEQRKKRKKRKKKMSRKKNDSQASKTPVIDAADFSAWIDNHQDKIKSNPSHWIGFTDYRYSVATLEKTVESIRTATQASLYGVMHSTDWMIRDGYSRLDCRSKKALEHCKAHANARDLLREHGIETDRLLPVTMRLLASETVAFVRALFQRVFAVVSLKGIRYTDRDLPLGVFLLALVRIAPSFGLDDAFLQRIVSHILRVTKEEKFRSTIYNLVNKSKHEDRVRYFLREAGFNLWFLEKMEARCRDELLEDGKAVVQVVLQSKEVVDTTYEDYTTDDSINSEKERLPTRIRVNFHLAHRIARRKRKQLAILNEIEREVADQLNPDEVDDSDEDQQEELDEEEQGSESEQQVYRSDDDQRQAGVMV